MTEQPKRPANGYFLYLEDHKAEFVKKAGGVYKQGISDASKAWKALGEKEKAPYEEKAKALKEQYEKDLKAFTDGGGVKAQRKRKSKGGDDDEDGKKKPKKEKDADAPKKPTGGAYGCFVSANRPKFQEACKGQPVTAVSKMAGEKWKALSEEEKKPFEAEYQEKKKKYEADMAAYKAK